MCIIYRLLLLPLLLQTTTNYHYRDGSINGFPMYVILGGFPLYAIYYGFALTTVPLHVPLTGSYYWLGSLYVSLCTSCSAVSRCMPFTAVRAYRRPASLPCPASLPASRFTSPFCLGSHFIPKY